MITKTQYVVIYGTLGFASEWASYSKWHADQFMEALRQDNIPCQLFVRES